MKGSDITVFSWTGASFGGIAHMYIYIFLYIYIHNTDGREI